MVYVPAGVFAGTSTRPVTVSSTGTGPPFIGVAGDVTVAVIALGTIVTPLSVSLAKALIMSLPPVAPFTAGGVSPEAAIAGAATTTVAIAFAQLFGFRRSQIW